MPCRRLVVEGQVVGFVCGPAPKPKPCAYCGKLSGRLCDWPGVRRGRKATCDLPMCADCTFSPAPEKDLCRPHRKLWEEKKAAPAVAAGGV